MKIFNDLKNAEFEYENGMAIDAGAVWQDSNYNLGLTLVNANKPEFSFSKVELEDFDNPEILSELNNSPIL